MDDIVAVRNGRCFNLMEISSSSRPLSRSQDVGRDGSVANKRAADADGTHCWPPAPVLMRFAFARFLRALARVAHAPPVQHRARGLKRA